MEFNKHLATRLPHGIPSRGQTMWATQPDWLFELSEATIELHPNQRLFENKLENSYSGLILRASRMGVLKRPAGKHEAEGVDFSRPLKIAGLFYTVIRVEYMSYDWIFGVTAVGDVINGDHPPVGRDVRG